MKFYIASGLENADNVEKLAAQLRDSGWTQTYNWTEHGSVNDEPTERIREVAHRELAGVWQADIVIVMLPGGRGTHVEMGAAIAWNKPVILLTEKEDKLQDGRTCSFYHHTRVIETRPERFPDFVRLINWGVQKK